MSTIVQGWMCPTCGGVKNDKPGYTYFIQRQGWVKVGFTCNIESRLKELAKGRVVQPQDMDKTEPLLLLALLDHNAEHLLHETFADDHVAGEWFLPGPAMRSFIEAAA